jgi:type II secretory pathway pseudopilin PulG
VIAVVGLLAAFSSPALLRASSRVRLGTAASEIRVALRLARSVAIRYSANAAAKFRTARNGAVTFAIYRDGDGDGVLNADIESGVDPVVVPVRSLATLGHGVRFGFPPGLPPRDPSDPSRRLDRLNDPIRFNNSDLASFDPLGGSTPGSIYLTDGRLVAALRVSGRIGKVRRLTWDPELDRWLDGE